MRLSNFLRFSGNFGISGNYGIQIPIDLENSTTCWQMFLSGIFKVIDELLQDMRVF